MLDAGDDDEQADEEEDGDPLDFVEHLDHRLRLLFGRLAEVVEHQQQRGAGDPDGSGFETERPRHDEGTHHQCQDERRQPQQARVADRLPFVELHDARTQLGRGLQPPAPDQVHRDDMHEQDDGDDRRQVEDEVVERQADLDRPTWPPIRMFGGSPISVAVPPMFDARICEKRKG
ncbi:MAG: hypothetical protein AW12_01645 [Candidatus Accumulibacter sp. BA-94]|nr:MAG: hypothetical protein AW12_01645 [Candidatus Accumulibacter sp. BA-94]